MYGSIQLVCAEAAEGFEGPRTSAYSRSTVAGANKWMVGVQCGGHAVDLALWKFQKPCCYGGIMT